jgi:uncharacterized integral membrane protein (TIGR00698 family)
LEGKINKPLNKVLPGLFLAVFIGLIGYGAKLFINSPLADPLLVALLFGILGRAALGDNQRFRPGYFFAPAIFLPAGIIFYGAHNLNFAKLIEVEENMLLLLAVVMVVYFAVILALGRLLGQRKQITYLTASGSAICGASAIAVTSPAVEAEPDDVSIALLSVAVAAFVGFSIILPFFAVLFDLTSRSHSVLSGSILQFTGLVKVASKFSPYIKKDMLADDILSLAISVKAIRYLGLLIAVPLFASLIKKKIYVPWFLWAFLAAGLLGTWTYVTNFSFYTSFIVPYIKPIHNISWSIAMAAIGLNANIKELLSNNGTKALIMAFSGFFAATAVFFMGLHLV